MRNALKGLALVGLAVSAAACGSGSSSGSGGTVNSVNQEAQKGQLGQNLDLSKLSPSIPDPSSPTTITYATFQTVDDRFKKIIDEFEQIHPNIDIKIQKLVPDSAQTKLTAQIAGGNVPDAAYVDSGTVGSFGLRGALASLDDYAAKSKAVEPDDFVPAFKQTAVVNGQLMGLPIDGESTALFYRKDLFQKAGIAGPPKTWAEFQADAAKLTDAAKKQYGIALFASPFETSYYWYPFLYQAGGQQTTNGDKDPAFNSPQAKKAAEFYVGLRKYSPPDLWNSNSFDGRVAFAQGKVGMYIAGGWFAGTMQDEFPKIDGKWGVAPLPTQTSGSQCATTIAGDDLVISSGSKNQDAAWKWIEFLSAPRNIARSTVGTPKEPGASLLPTRLSLLNDQKLFSFNPIEKGFVANMKCGITNLSENPNWGDVDGGPLSDALAKGIFGKEDVSKALDDAAQQAKDMLNKPA